MTTSRPIRMEPVYEGSAQIATGSADATGAQILAADPYRKWGVLVQNISAASGPSIKVGTVTGDAVILLAIPGGSVNTLNSVFIPGTGSLFIKSINGTINGDYAVMYL